MVLLSSGHGPKQIAGHLGITTHTARVHSSRIMAKMGARSIADLVRMVDTLEALSHAGTELCLKVQSNASLSKITLAALASNHDR